MSTPEPGAWVSVTGDYRRQHLIAAVDHDLPEHRRVRLRCGKRINPARLHGAAPDLTRCHHCRERAVG